MKTLDNQFDYWDSVSSSRTFTHPVDVDRFHSVVSSKANILDFGCGYGRTCDELYRLGFRNIIGVDSSQRISLQLEPLRRTMLYISALFPRFFPPAFRIGFCVAPELIRKWLVLVKQGVDLHTSTFNQALAAEYISGGHLEQQLPKITSIYRPKQEAMLNALEKYFPDSFRWSKPEGGMFFWAEGVEGLDMERIYWKSIKKKAAFVPGKFFFTRKGEGIETMRLNYTMTDEDTIDKAVKILSEVIK